MSNATKHMSKRISIDCGVMWHTPKNTFKAFRYIRISNIIELRKLCKIENYDREKRRPRVVYTE